MMKIHTTQNLNSLVQNHHSTNYLSSRDFRFNYSEQMQMPSKANYHDSYLPAFKGKESMVKNSKKAIKMLKKNIGDVAKDGQPTKQRGDGFLNSSFFDKVLNVTEYETVIQAAMAAIVCIGLRPATIMAMSSRKSKEDNTYASSHSIASGVIGLLATIMLTTPFKSGGKYTMKAMLKDLDKDALKRMYPHLDLKSIWKDEAHNVRKPVEEWLDSSGNAFSQEIKDVSKLPVFTHIADSSEQTLHNVLKVDADWAANKGKSFNDITLKDGRKLYDVINMDRLGIVVKEEGMGDAQILFKDMDKEYLEQLIKDSSDNNWSKLNINSVFGKDGKVVDFRNWKDIDGKQWKLDLDTVSVSSPFETVDYRPRISGKKRFDSKDKETKFVTYQKNGKNDMLGTEIKNEMVKAEAKNEIVNKLLTWFPDLLFRVPIAVSTIALIPWVLKNIFNVEKKKPQVNEQKTIEIKPDEKINNKAVEKNENTIAFKGKAPQKPSWFARKFGETYGKYVIETKWISDLADKLTSLPGNMTQHMATLGSLITSSVYVQQTLNKKDLDPERRRTLAINQVLCFIIPTIAAYTVDSAINGWVKKKEYRYSGWQEHKAEMAKFKGEDKTAKTITKGLGGKLKGIRILSSLFIFTTIYRYITPVLITPVANKIGNWYNSNQKAKKEAELIK